MAFESLKNIPKEQHEFATPPKFSTLQYRYETLIERIENGTMNNDQLKMDIINNYRDYCNYDNFHDANRKSFQKLWTNKRFLNGFLNALSVIQADIVNNSYYRTSICKIAYDYYCKIGKNNQDDEVFKLLQRIANTINKREVLVLSAFMHEQSASFIMMANYSSFNQSTNIIRLNEYIIKLGYEFTVQNIIDIYSELYRENFSALFNTTMTQIVPYGDSYTRNHRKTLIERQNTALLTILEKGMPSYEIKNVLKAYFDYCESHPMRTTIFARFDINAISEKDFPRVYKILKEG